MNNKKCDSQPCKIVYLATTLIKQLSEIQTYAVKKNHMGFFFLQGLCQYHSSRV